MIGSLSLAIMILLSFFYGLKRFSQKEVFGSKGKLVQVLSSHYLGGKRSVLVLKVPKTFLIIGITDNQINLLARFNEEEWPNIMSSDGDSVEENSFLGTLLKRKPKSGGDHD
jgi:flagellar biogenesis protein FliO